MHKKIVVLIQSGPLVNHRACEGIRIALGLISSEHQVTVLLTRQGLGILREDKTDFVDEDRLTHFLSAFEGFSDVFFVDAASCEACGFSAEVEDSGAEFLSQEACALKIAAADCFFTF